MILDSDVSPTRTLYYIGGQVLRAFKAAHSNSLTLEELRLHVSRLDNAEIPLSYLLLSLDWLYLLDLISLDDAQRIRRCF